MESEILTNNFNFLKEIEKLIINESIMNDKFKLLDFYADFAVNNPNGSLHNPLLEYHLLDISENIPFQFTENKLNKSLIIMSEAYKHGGHTRIVEHAINYSESNQHDLLFTRNNFVVPNSLSEICQNKQCSVMFLSDGEVMEKAKQLRDISSKYDRIIMHIHPEDYFPLLAFGHSNWNIPIFLYNHAEHRSWFGISIVDVVMDLSSRAKTNSLKYRKILKSEILDIPIITSEINRSKNEILREQLNIDKNSVVFLSGGSPYKYSATKELDFNNVVDLILGNIYNSYFVIIGINPESSEWVKMKNKFQNRLILIEQLEYCKYLEYLNIVNIYIDSMPVSGFTVLLENAMRTIPIIFLDTQASFPDSIVDEAISYNMILKKVEKIIDNGITQEVNLENHKIENFIYKYNNILDSNLIHYRNLNVNQVVDFSENSFIRYVLKDVYKDKITLDKSKFSILPFYYKLVLLTYIIKELKEPLVILKIIVDDRIKKLIKKLIK